MSRETQDDDGRRDQRLVLRVGVGGVALVAAVTALTLHSSDRSAADDTRPEVTAARATTVMAEVPQQPVGTEHDDGTALTTPFGEVSMGEPLYVGLGTAGYVLAVGGLTYGGPRLLRRLKRQSPEVHLRRLESQVAARPDEDNTNFLRIVKENELHRTVKYDVE